MSDSQTGHNYSLLGAEIWLRLVFMLIYALLLNVAVFVLSVFVVIQFVLVLCTGSANVSLQGASASTAEFTLQAWQFLSFNSEEKPFPFRDWPGQ